MPTPFAVTVLYLLCTLDNSGRLAPVDKAELPAPITTPLSFNEEHCLVLRGKMAHPERYVCQRWTGEPMARWSFGATEEAPPPPPPAAKPEPPPEPPPKPTRRV